ncbi:50S ribosomal protein L2 [Patescibacteria group bacterium]|nr:50S ribosomal protein L2 [Patescibacteria group bacterium]
MPIKIYRPNTSGRRISSVQDTSDVTRKSPEKKLTVARKEFAGRTKGKLTVRHKGGGVAQRIRIVDFRRDKFDIPARVDSIEYDPNRGARISLLVYKDGEKRYMLMPDGQKVGDMVVSTKGTTDIAVGNRMSLGNMPVGVTVHSVELQPGKGGQIGRGAGTSIQIMAVEGSYATLKLPSGETRNVQKDCMATIGTVSNPDWRLVRWGKAGRMRLRGIKPTVRGKAMNPVDHPHGGGEGKHPIGMKYAKTKWGKHAMGVKTRRKNRPSDRLILKRRRKK